MNRLSKSNYLKGMQCMKSLFLKIYHPELRDEISEVQQAIFDKGHLVGRTAQELFPEGIDASEGKHIEVKRSLEYTKELIGKGIDVIYEAAFEYDGVLCYMDILVKENGKWKAYEVKGSTGLKDYYLHDASLQYYVINNTGLKLDDIFLAHLNNKYVRKGKLEIKELFTVESVKDRVIAMQDSVKENIVMFKNLLAQKNIPNIDIGDYCSNPYNCDFIGYCWKHIPENSVFNISKLRREKKFDLYQKGILNFNDIPKNYPLNNYQRMQVNSELNSNIYRDQKKLDQFRKNLKYPLYFMDFETMQPAIPLFNDSRPYQQIPFQYSLHILEKPGATLQHFEFLGKPPKNPRTGFIITLLDNIGKTGSILVYNKAFEIRILNEIARDFPEYKIQIEKIFNRIVDLMEPFRDKYIYMPEMKGSYSIKHVLPAMVPGFSYSTLDIQNGSIASNTFESMYYDVDKYSINEKRKQLLEYCKMDTLAMVKILEKI